VVWTSPCGEFAYIEGIATALAGTSSTPVLTSVRTPKRSDLVRCCCEVVFLVETSGKCQHQKTPRQEETTTRS
jgi:hypothetical protein